nr:TIR domain-containing protein [uncultured Cohaesibacter sp.]
MFEMQYETNTLAQMSEEEFAFQYNESETQKFLSYIETRIRFELVNLIRVLDRKGEIFIEVRKKSSISAYNKLRKELKKISYSEKIYLTDIIKDFVGCRIICNDEDTLSSVFNSIMQSETFQIQDNGFELYSAPFRRFESRQTRYSRLIEVLGLNEDGARQPSDLEKQTNYESLHCFLSFSTPYDIFDMLDKQERFRQIDNDRRHRYVADVQHLKNLISELGHQYSSIAKRFPIECQIRTINEHMWAQEEHKYVYEKVKSGSISSSDEKIELLKGVFTALKHAYRNIDDLRDLVKNISHGAAANRPHFTGASKDVSDDRLAFFDDPAIKSKISRIDREYRLLLTETKESSQVPIRKLYKDITLIFQEIRATRSDIEGKTEFSSKIWGQDRLLYMLLGYIFLTSRLEGCEFEEENFFRSIGLDKFLGNANLRTASIHRQAGLMLASRIYNALISYDEFSYSISDEVNLPSRYVFRDPLLYVRYASSLFLQERFAEARDSLDQILYAEDWSEFREGSSPYSPEFSFYELYMRRNQYAWFRNYSEKDRLIENISQYQKDIDVIFSSGTKDYPQNSEKKFRAYCWFLFANCTLKSLKVILPGNYRRYKEDAILFVSSNSQEYGPGHRIWEKPEVIGAFHSVPALFELKKYEVEFKSIDSIIENNSYPVAARKILADMLFNTLIKSTDNIEVKLPKVFFSYSHKDKNYVDRIMSHLSQAGIHILSDKDFEAGDSLLSGMENAIKDANTSIIVVSENYIQSTGWLQREREAIVTKNAAGEGDIIVISKDVPIEEIRKAYPMLANDLIKQIPEDVIRYQIHSVISKILKKGDEE